MTKASRYKLARNFGLTKYKPAPAVNIEKPAMKPLSLLVKAIVAGHLLAHRHLAAIQAQAESKTGIGTEAGDKI